MKIEILSIDRTMLGALHRTSVLYSKDNVKQKVIFVSENELTETEIKIQINED